MDEQNRVTDLEELLQNASWVKNLAYASLRDYALAEDVSQEVLLKAIAEPKRSGRVLRAWLAAVTRNMARNEIRGLMRRRARERKVVERSAGADSDLNQTDLMHAHRDLTYVVESLAPKHREVIVQRFFEGLSFREVSLNLGISQGNVRIRLHRALQELRTILEDRSGDWYASCLLLAPMGSAPVPVSALPKAAQFMAAVVAASVIGSVWLWQGAEHANSEPSEPTLIAQAVDSEESAALLHAAALDLGNANQQQIERETLALATAWPQVPKPCEGLVLYDGFPVPGAQIVVGQEAGISRTTTNAEGQFSIQLPSSSWGMVSAIFDGKYGTEIFDSIEGFPKLLLIYELNPRNKTLTVLDGETRKGIPGARVQVFANWVGGREDAAYNIGEPELIAEHTTDSAGHFPYPNGVPPDLIEFIASAPGYVSSSNDGQKAVLFPGRELPVQLLHTNGDPLANVAVVSGYLPRIQQTDADGFIPRIRNWRRVERDGEYLLVPEVLMVRLADGRLWRSWFEAIAQNHAVIYEGVLQITVDETPLQVELQNFPLKEGEYVEAACASRWWRWTQEGEGSIWQRLHLGETTALTRGWVNPEVGVAARIMPGKISLGTFPVVDGKATIAPDLIDFQLTVVGPSIHAGKPLILRVEGEEAHVQIPIVNGVAKSKLRVSPKYYCEVMEVLSGKRLLLKHPDKSWTRYLEFQPQNRQVEAVVYELANSLQPVLIRVDGVPVSGKRVGPKAIGLDGQVEIPFDAQGNPLMDRVELMLPGELVHQSGGPTLTSMMFRGGAAIPGRWSRLANGDRVWDLELAHVELWIPASDSLEKRQFKITQGAAETVLLVPNPGAYSNMMFVPPEAGWYTFRVPAENYAFKVGEITYGGVGGVNLPGGQLTRLEPDSGEKND